MSKIALSSKEILSPLFQLIVTNAHLTTNNDKLMIENVELITVVSG